MKYLEKMPRFVSEKCAAAPHLSWIRGGECVFLPKSSTMIMMMMAIMAKLIREA